MAKPGLTLTGHKALDKKLRTLGDKVQRRVTRKAVNAAATPVLKAARAKAPKQSGLLKKAMGKKVATNKKTGDIVGIVGARKQIEGEYQGEKRKPSRYSHLVEKGFIDSSGKFVPPSPFLFPALDETEGQALDILRDKFAEGVIREAAK